jgi:hypothetical protein
VNNLIKGEGEYMKKYICYGGYIPSKTDQDMHYISAKRLAQLYNVRPSDCLMIDDYNKEEKMKGLNVGNIIELHPRYNGDYLLP